MTISPSAVPLYLDECVDHRVVPILRVAGLHVTTARDEGTNGLDDDKQIEYAAARGYVIVSHNQRHFFAWHRRFIAAGRAHNGMLLCPQTQEEPASLGVARLALRVRMLTYWLALQSRINQLVTWGRLETMFQRGVEIEGFSREEVRFARGLPGTS